MCKDYNFKTSFDGNHDVQHQEDWKSVWNNSLCLLVLSIPNDRHNELCPPQIPIGSCDILERHPAIQNSIDKRLQIVCYDRRLVIIINFFHTNPQLSIVIHEVRLTVLVKGLDRAHIPYIYTAGTDADFWHFIKPFNLNNAST